MVYEGLHQFDVGIPPAIDTPAQCIAPLHPGHFLGKSPVHSIISWEADEELVLALTQQALTQDVMPTVDTVVNVCRGVAGNHSIIGAMIRERILDQSFLCNLTVSDCVRLGKALGEMGGTASESALVMLLRCAMRPDLQPRVKAPQARCLLLMLANLPEKYHDEPMKWCLSSLLLPHLPVDAGRMLDVMWALGTLRMDSKEMTCPICDHLTAVLENQPTVTTAEWTCIAWTMARNRWFHLPLVSRLLKHAKEELHHSNVEVITTMLWSLSRLGVQTQEILHQASLALLRHMNPQDSLSTMACVLWLYAQHNHLKDEPVLLRHIADCIATSQVWTMKVCVIFLSCHQGEATPTDVGVIAWSLFTLGFQHPCVRKRLAEWVGILVLELDSITLCNIAGLYTTYKDDTSAMILDVLGLAIMKQGVLRSLPLKGLQMIEWAYTVIDVPISGAVLYWTSQAIEEQCVDLTESEPQAFHPSLKCQHTALPCESPDVRKLGFWLCMTM